MEALLTTVTGGVVVERGPQLRAGDRVGEYQVEKELGAGGMGQVYAVVHPVIGKRAAAKVLHPELSRDHEAIARFVQEARAVNQIGHPNIVDIFGFGQLDDARAFFVMERLTGESLRTRVERGRLALNEAIAILDGIAIALEAAHAAGIVHRDLKPDNVFLVGGNQVKLLDFGIAKLVGGIAGGPKTSAGRMMGTPAYVSPEQASGDGVDHRTDVYALGVVAFELLAGRLPFLAKTPLHMITQHLGDPPPAVRSIAPEVPAALDALVLRLLAKRPDERPTLAETRDVLQSAMSPAALPVATPVVPVSDVARVRARRVPRIAIAALSIGAVVGIGAAVVLSSSGTTVAPATVKPAPSPPAVAPIVEAQPEPAKPEPAKPEPPKPEPPRPEPTPKPDPVSQTKTVSPPPDRVSSRKPDPNPATISKARPATTPKVAKKPKPHPTSPPPTPPVDPDAPR